MTAQSLDLVYELQVELGWTPEFAATAHSEYMRWLRLRAQSGDYQYCKLPPSRVVGTVWALHRQWTQDYENICTGLGGFIHHFPPAMRMNIAMEEAYAATLHTYKTMYKQDPPVSHWGPAICTYKPLSSSAPTTVALNIPEPPPRALPSLRRSPTKRDTSMLKAPTTPTKSKRAAAEASRRISAAMSAQAAADKSRTTSDLARPQRRHSKSAKDVKSLAVEIQDVDLDDSDQPLRSPGRPRKKFSGPSPLYVLKPLRPGEKRKRGRPSFSDYVLASSVNQTSAAGEKKKKDTEIAAEKPLTPRTASVTHSLRRRKSVASPSITPSAAPSILKKEKGHKPFRRVAKSSATSTISDANKTGPGVAAGSHDNQPGPAGKDVSGPVKRPRGRPRKDGSWPVPRVRKTEAASKPAPPVAQKSATASEAADKVKERNEDAPKVALAKTSGDGTGAPGGVSIAVPGVQPVQASGGVPTLPGGHVQAPAPGTTVPVPTSGATVPVSGGSTAVISANVTQPVSTATAVAMSAPREAAIQTKQVNPAESVLGQAAMDNAVPSKIVEGRDLQMQDLTEKEVSKPQNIHEGMARDGVFEQIMDGSGLGEKDRPVDMSNPLSGRDMRMGQDVVFPQSETVRDPAEMDMSLGSGPSRPDNVTNIGGAPVEIIPQGHQGGEKPFQQANTFSMNPMNVVQPVSNPLGTGMLPMRAGTVQGRPEMEGEKDADLQMEDGDPRKPFKRPRGRPRKDGTWPVPRAKPMNDEAVERVKDISDPALNFPVGPSGTV